MTRCLQLVVCFIALTSTEAFRKKNRGPEDTTPEATAGIVSEAPTPAPTPPVVIDEPTPAPPTGTTESSGPGQADPRCPSPADTCSLNGDAEAACKEPHRLGGYENDAEGWCRYDLGFPTRCYACGTCCHTRTTPTFTPVPTRSPTFAPTAEWTVAPVTPGSEATDKLKLIAEWAVWTFGKATQGASVYSQWGMVKLAVNETVIAAQEASEAVVALASKIREAAILFISSGLQHYFTVLHNGVSDLDNLNMLKGMIEKTAADGEAEFMKAMEMFRSMSHELMEITQASDAVVTVINGVQDLGRQVASFSDAWVDVDLSMFDPLKAHAQTAKEILNGLITVVEKQFREVQTMVHDYLLGLYANATDSLNAYVRSIFGDMGAEIEAFNVVFTMVVEPLVRTIVDGVRQVSEIVQTYMLPEGAPDNVADEELGRWSGCAWRSTRYFDSIDDVDIEKTMECSMSWFGQYSCTCIGKYDCYATKSYRPDPSGLKRCFKRVSGR